jgi:hypothetical protein
MVRPKPDNPGGVGGGGEIVDGGLQVFPELKILREYILN